MKKKLSMILALVLTFCMSISVFAAPSTFPTSGEDARQQSTFTIEKKYVDKEGTVLKELFPGESLQFKVECKAAPVELTAAPEVKVDKLEVQAVTNDITVTIPAYTVPGKYNYEIKELSPSNQIPSSKDTAGVVYDKNSIFIQVVVKYENGALKKYVTVAADGTTVGAETDTSNDATKKADFKNKYLLDGEVDPDPTNPDKPHPTDKPDKPNPNPNPIPDPNLEPDPIPTPAPDPEENPEVAQAKFKIMKHVRGPLASRDQEFTVHVTLKSVKPVRSNITCNDGTEHVITKVDAQNSGWTGNEQSGYTATLDLSIKNGETVTFKGVPAGVEYTVQEDAKHIAKLDADNINKPEAGYTVSYYGGGDTLTNPTPDNPGKYGADLAATGMVGYDTNNNIVISNSKGLNNEDSDIVRPNTGIGLDSLPYIIILCLVIAGAGVMIVKGRKRREE